MNSKEKFDLIPSFSELLDFLLEKDPENYEKFSKCDQNVLKAKYDELANKAKKVEEELKAKEIQIVKGPENVEAKTTMSSPV